MWSNAETVVLRYRSIDGAFRAARPLTVVEDGPEWLVTHLPEDTVVAVPVLTDGRGLRDVPLEERWMHPRATSLRPWARSDLVMLFPRDREFSLWLFRERGTFRGWYVNLEERHIRGARTIDTRDHVLDLWELVTRRDDELGRVGPHPLVRLDGELDPLQALEVHAFAQELDHLGGRVLGRDLFENRRNHAARTAPLGPVVDQDRLGALDDVGVEAVVGDDDRALAHGSPCGRVVGLVSARGGRVVGGLLSVRQKLRQELVSRRPRAKPGVVRRLVRQHIRCLQR